MPSLCHSPRTGRQETGPVGRCPRSRPRPVLADFLRCVLASGGLLSGLITILLGLKSDLFTCARTNLILGEELIKSLLALRKEGLTLEMSTTRRETKTYGCDHIADATGVIGLS